MPLETINLSSRGAQEEKFTPTPEELRTIQEKMKDPKFVELFQDYVKSMEDPETRREEEAYLQQVEREAKAGGDHSFDFVFPTPGFVVELLEPATSYRVTHSSLKVGDKKNKRASRVYVNMCSSSKIDPFSEQSTGDNEKSNWLVPVSVSRPRTEFFSEDVTTSAKSGEKQPKEDEDVVSPVVVYDAVFHPDTLQLADRSDRFCCFLVNIAVEHINSGYGDSHGFEFRRLSSRIRAVGTPQNQTISREKGKSPFAAAMNEPVLTQPTKILPPSPATDGNRKPAPGKKDRETGGMQSATKAAGTSMVGAGRVSSDKIVKKEHLPHCTVAHRGHIDLSETWGWKIVDRRIGVPETLVVKMEFTGVRSASELNIEVESAYVTIAKASTHPYYGTLTLPFSVESTPLEAKFERKKALLTLVLRVVPPAPTGLTAEDMRQELGAAREPSVSEVKDTKEMTGEHAVASVPGPATAGFADNNETSTERAVSPELACPPAAESSEETLFVPQVSSIGDQDRVRLMMEKVQAARRERERAATKSDQLEVCVDKTEDTLQEKEHEKIPDERVFEDAKQETQREADTESVASAEPPLVPLPAPTVPLMATDVDAPVGVEDGTNFAKNAADLELLQQRQESWKNDMHRRIEAREDEEREKAFMADREARREAERLRKRAEAARRQEELAVKLGERMTELPLRNRHIFTVD
ncbi:putative protein kintoun-like [Trypanosoma rangeli]|uniref:Dynein assembly factor 2, axonemal homolog n=1 Tax=Trypanosoma rangeli TaxID=5698 RepID=A0A3R7N1E2_TRYRA|nr:putative protein kintoun-like [Trypanosoma rangeli]RNF11242.1 putative protein kintoun-like [Trypanosoma rangeli]|eukprot:RNF11242.1 putative protein kintoun-like [Trypanosoma rangeli]